MSLLRKCCARWRSDTENDDHPSILQGGNRRRNEVVMRISEAEYYQEAHFLAFVISYSGRG